MSASRARSLLPIAAGLLPALATLGCILVYGVDVPYWDDWDNPGRLLESEILGTLDSHSFFAQQSESRPFFPRLVFYAMAHTIGWHPKLCMILSWLATLLTTGILAGFLRRQGDRGTFHSPPSGGTLVTVFLLSALTFSIAQYQSQLWAIQYLVFTSQLCLVCCLRLAYSRFSLPLIMLGGAALSSIATYSFANGMICWVLGAPPLALAVQGRAGASGSPQRRRFLLWSAFYVICAVLAVGLYFWGYKRPAQYPAFQISDALIFFATWIGAPFTAGFASWTFTPVAGDSSASAVLLGGVLLSMSAALLAIVGRHTCQAPGRALLAAAFPWLVALAYGLGSGIVASAGRVGFGMHWALAPRYASFSLWVTIGLLGLCHTLSRERPGRASATSARVFAAALALFAVLAAGSWLSGARHMPLHGKIGLQNLLSLRLAEVFPDHPQLKWLDPFRQRARLLEEHGILSYQPVGSWIREAARKPHPGGGGSYRAIRIAEGVFVLRGTAVLPTTGDPADCVLLCTRLENGARRLESGLALADRQPGSWRRSGFTVRLPPGMSLGEIVFLAVDLRNRKLYELHPEGT